MNNSYNFCNNLSNSLPCSCIKFRHLVFMALFKYTFSYLSSKTVRNSLVEMLKFSDSEHSSIYAFKKDSSGVILSLFQYWSFYIPKSTMVDDNPFNVLLPPLIVCSETFRFNTNDVKRFLPKIIPYINLAELFMWYSHITILSR